jgi:hypothetical protein
MSTMRVTRAEIAADRGVHEAGEEWNVAKPEEVGFGILPRADVCLEEFHDGSDDVEDEDDLGFADGLHAKDEQESLDGECGEEEEVVAGEWRVRWVEEFGEEDEREEDSTEEAGPGLLEGEEEELPKDGVAG